MKKLIAIIVFFYPLALMAQGGHFVLKAKVSGLHSPAMAYLYYSEGGKSIIDSVKSSTGSFEFSGTISDICSGRLTLDHEGVGLFKLGINRDVLPILLENGNIFINASDSIKNGTISNSLINQQNSIYIKYLSANETAYKQLMAKSMAATPEQRKDSVYRKQKNQRFKKLSEEYEQLQIQFIKQHPDYYVSLLAVIEVAGPIIDLDKILPLYNGLAKKLRTSSKGVEFAKKIAQAQATGIGATAPAFTQNDVNDKPVSLADFRGKYVLVDFWASWCGPCRAENPNVVKAFQRYKGKNFTVLGVSLDRPGKKDDWLAAIKADGLEWTQVSDLKFWNNEVAKLYGVRAIPQNFLIGPDGKIVGKNLSGEELNKKLLEIFGS